MRSGLSARHIFSTRRHSSAQDFEANCKVLGVSSAASHDEVKAAFHKLSLVWHPDKNDGSHEARDKFQAIVEAYDQISRAMQKIGTVGEDTTHVQQSNSYQAMSSQYDSYLKGVREENREMGRPMEAGRFKLMQREDEGLPAIWKDETPDSGFTFPVWAGGTLLTVLLGGAYLIISDGRAG